MLCIFIRSMRNRINAYEDRHKRSEAELSESTRPDLSVPLPDLPHLQPEDNEANDKSYRPSSSAAAASATSGGSSSAAASAAAHGGQASTAMDGSTILRIPKVPKTVPPPSASPSPAGEPTKIRVRTDLMHQLGLMSNTDPNAVNRNSTTAAASAAKKRDSFNIDHLVSSPSSRTPQPKGIAQPPQPRSSNLLQLLNDPPKKQQVCILSAHDLLTFACMFESVYYC